MWAGATWCCFAQITDYGHSSVWNIWKSSTQIGSTVFWLWLCGQITWRIWVNYLCGSEGTKSLLEANEASIGQFSPAALAAYYSPICSSHKTKLSPAGIFVHIMLAVISLLNQVLLGQNAGTDAAVLTCRADLQGWPAASVPGFWPGSHRLTCRAAANVHLITSSLYSFTVSFHSLTEFLRAQLCKH